MDVQQKLSGFYKIVTSEAQKKREEIFNQVKNDIKNNFEYNLQKSLKRAIEKVNTKKFESEQLKNKEIVEAISLSRKNILLLRAKLKNELFDEVEKKVIEFAKSHAYFEHIESELKKINYENPLIELSSEDKDLLAYLQKKFTFEFFISKENFLGGYRIYLQNSKIVIDKSFLQRLEKSKESFNEFKLPNL